VTKKQTNSGLKTSPNDRNVDDFLKKVENGVKRADCYAFLKLMKDVTYEEPRMWGDSIVGFGNYHYRYVSGREGDWFLIGFSPRKQNLTIYIVSGFERYDDLLAKLGKFRTGKSCLYVNKLYDIDEPILKELMLPSVKYVKTRYK
jgi:hypothetical protein